LILIGTVLFSGRCLPVHGCKWYSLFANHIFIRENEAVRRNKRLSVNLVSGVDLVTSPEDGKIAHLLLQRLVFGIACVGLGLVPLVDLLVLVWPDYLNTAYMFISQRLFIRRSMINGVEGNRFLLQVI